MLDITVLILTKNEEKNIARCITSAKLIADRIVVVDCGSVDATVELAKTNGADVFFHEWEGHAAQFNWALDNCGIKTEWVFRLDADEQISTELAEEIGQALNSATTNQIDGYAMRWYIYFMNKKLRFGGTHKPYFLRLFRYGKGRVENKLMDEHIVVDGSVQNLSGSLIHYDYKGIDTWLHKHIWYSDLEIQMVQSGTDEMYGNIRQRNKRSFYYKLPIFWRVRFYFWYRYFLQGGFLDGTEGRIFCFLQAYWYRFLVDAKLYEQKESKGESE